MIPGDKVVIIGFDGGITKALFKHHCDCGEQGCNLAFVDINGHIMTVTTSQLHNSAETLEHTLNYMIEEYERGIDFLRSENEK